MLTASVCTIGDEILIGQIVDTNSAYISKELNSIGIKVNFMLSVPDEEEQIVNYLNLSLSRSDIVIVTGGLGPTKDDITKNALATLSGSPRLVYNGEQLDIISSICHKRGIELSNLNRDQSLVPERCEVLTNSMGTAPGILLRKEGKLLFSLPGVPYEMANLMKKVTCEIIKAKGIEDIYHKTLITFGIPESSLATKISVWEENLPSEIKLAYLPDPLTGVKLRLSKYGGNINDSKKEINEQFAALKTILGNAVYGEDNETLESVIIRFLKSKSATLSTAESCTGGKIASMITSVPGSSSIFAGGIIAYSNEVKVKTLGVDPAILSEYGAVSEECVKAMAQGARKIFNTNYAVATSGIAGPDGGSEEKPVGTVWIAVAGPDFLVAKKAVFGGDRLRNIDRFSSETLNFLRLNLGI
jgi:nicotinamide-nucleotide amidase